MHCVVQTAADVLNLADGLVGLGFVLQLGVADSLEDGLFASAFDFLDLPATLFLSMTVS